MGEDSFKKFNGTKHTGPFLASAFQGIATGVFNNLQAILATKNNKDWLKNKIEEFYATDTFISNTTPGVRAIPRYKDLSKFGEEYFKP